MHVGGLAVSTNGIHRTHFRRAIAEVKTDLRVRTVKRGGWHAPKAGAAPIFMLPTGEMIGDAGAEAVVLAVRDPQQAARYGRAGTLEGWRDGVAALAYANPTAVLCIAAAFAGPLLAILGVQAAGLHLFGGSKNGKTMAARSGLSVWGKPAKDGALLGWNNTAGTFAAMAEGASDALLYLDETGEADPATVARVVYELANGAERGRLTRDAQARARREWRTFTLSTGETDLVAVCAKAGQKLPEGASVRLPSVPLPAGQVWPALHGRADKEGLWRALNDALTAHYGVAGPVFLERLAAERAGDEEKLRRHLREEMDAFIATCVPAGADAQVREVARTFALAAAAGELAATWGVLSWPAGTASAACVDAFERWMDARGGIEAGEEITILRHLRRFLVNHGTSRFQAVAWHTYEGQPGKWELVNDPARPVINRVGWRYVKDGVDSDYAIPPETWASDVFPGMDAGNAAKVLAKGKHLRTEQEHRMIKRQPPNEPKSRRMYVVKAASLFADPAPAGEAPQEPDEMFSEEPATQAQDEEAW